MMNKKPEISISEVINKLDNESLGKLAVLFDPEWTWVCYNCDEHIKSSPVFEICMMDRINGYLVDSVRHIPKTYCSRICAPDVRGSYCVTPDDILEFRDLITATNNLQR